MASSKLSDGARGLFLRDNSIFAPELLDFSKTYYALHTAYNQEKLSYERCKIKLFAIREFRIARVSQVRYGIILKQARWN
jgi:hypothetical protein